MMSMSNKNDVMHRLPDGSGFFTAEIGDRPPGLVNRLKHHPDGRARHWLLFYRNSRTAYTLSRHRDQGPPMSPWRSIRWAWTVHPRLWR
jgi:hypothetical protein